MNDRMRHNSILQIKGYRPHNYRVGSNQIHPGSDMILNRPAQYWAFISNGTYFPISNREITAPWQYNMFNRGAGGRALTQSETQTEGGGYYEYIWGIYGAFDYGTSDRCNSEFEK